MHLITWNPNASHPWQSFVSFHCRAYRPCFCRRASSPRVPGFTTGGRKTESPGPGGTGAQRPYQRWRPASFVGMAAQDHDGMQACHEAFPLRLPSCGICEIDWIWIIWSALVGSLYLTLQTRAVGLALCSRTTIASHSCPSPVRGEHCAPRCLDGKE